MGSHYSEKPATLWFVRLWALIAKEFEQIWRDPSSWLVAGALPLVFLLLFGYGVSLDAGILRISVLSRGAGKAGLEIAANFAHSPWFEAYAPQDAESAATLLRNSQSQGYLAFWPDFDGQTAAGKPARIQLIIDGSEPNTARFMEMYSRRLLADWQATRKPGGVAQPAPIGVEERFWYNAEAKSEYFLVPGSITVVMTLIGTLLTSLVFAREWERGTIEVLFTTPVSRLQILLGKLVPYFCLGMLAMGLCTALGIGLYNVPFRGSFSVLALLSGIFLITALGQGLMISICLKKQLIAAQAGLYTGFLPSLLLSGFVFDIQSMPPLLRWLSRILPTTWFNTCIRTIFLTGDVWAVFLPCIGALLLLGALFLGIVYVRLEKRLN